MCDQKIAEFKFTAKRPPSRRRRRRERAETHLRQRNGTRNAVDIKFYEKETRTVDKRPRLRVLNDKQRWRLEWRQIPKKCLGFSGLFASRRRRRRLSEKMKKAAVCESRGRRRRMRSLITQRRLPPPRVRASVFRPTTLRSHPPISS